MTDSNETKTATSRTPDSFPMVVQTLKESLYRLPNCSDIKGQTDGLPFSSF